MASVNILIADDHPLFRAALRQILIQAQDDLGELHLSEAGSIADTHEQLSGDGEVDLVLLDLHMPGSAGFSGLAHLRGCFPTTPVLIVSGSDEKRVIRQAAELGASGFISKTDSPECIVEAVKRVLAGDQVFSDAALRNASGLDVQAVELADRLATLTPHQYRVYSMIVRGMLNKQIAYDLDITLQTAKTHVTAILRKLGVRDRKQVIILSRMLDVENPVDQL